MSITTPPQHSISPTTSTDNNASSANPTSNSATKLAEAIDDFLGDLETKFKGISDEILTKLDDMAERCDRLESELLMKEVGMAETGSGKARNAGGA